MSIPRVALCADTFEEPNGVATVTRQFAAFAQRHGYPLFLVRPGKRRQCFQDGSLTIAEVPRGWPYLPLDMGLRFDLRISRHFDWLRERMHAFDPDVVHITGPGDIGMVCARLSHVLRVPKPPLVAAWHTNLHQYARLRLNPVLNLLPKRTGESLGSQVERGALWSAAKFYQTARLILAPNAEILGHLTRMSGKPGAVMLHGVDTDLFRPPLVREPGPFTLGYVGRLTPEKNVRFLAKVAAGLPEHMRKSVRFLIVGDGSERHWLERHLPGAEFTGILRGQKLADAFARMDLFLFPSQSDTFGLVLLEAMASGVPVVSFRLSGPKSAVDQGETGFTSATPEEFIQDVVRLIEDRELHGEFRRSARASAERHGWDEVFSSVYAAYEKVLPQVQQEPIAVRLGHAAD